MIPFNRPSIAGEELDYIRDAIARGQLSGDGHYTQQCSRLLSKLSGGGQVLLTHSCTAALEMAAILCDLGPGDEVIMPSFTFVSTANAVALRGATPVFVDICPDTFNIDPAAAAGAVTDATKAIFAVHYAGYPADIEPLQQLAQQHGLRLVEDAAQALGSTYDGRLCGSLGDMATFSFHETKNIISGEGGALVVNDPELALRAEIIREKGTNRSGFQRGEVAKYTWVDIGSSYLPGELIAAFLYGQLERHQEIREHRLRLWDAYAEAVAPLASTGQIQLPTYSDRHQHNGHLFCMLWRNGDERNAFITHMRSLAIMTPFHYVPLHDSPAGQRLGKTPHPLPVTSDVSDRLVRLPMFWSLGDDQAKVLDGVRSFATRAH